MKPFFARVIQEAATMLTRSTENLPRDQKELPMEN